MRYPLLNQRIQYLEDQMESKKQESMDSLQAFLQNPNSREALILYVRKGTAYFNSGESLARESLHLDIIKNKNRLVDIAETCHTVLGTFLKHNDALRELLPLFDLEPLVHDKTTFSSMQRMVAHHGDEYLCQDLRHKFVQMNLPTHGFDNPGEVTMKHENWKLIVGLLLGVFFAVIVLALALFIPDPTRWQIFVFRGVFALSLSAITAIIPGLLEVNAKWQQVNIRAGGAIAVFVIVWAVNPPALLIN